MLKRLASLVLTLGLSADILTQKSLAQSVPTTLPSKKVEVRKTPLTSPVEPRTEVQVANTGILPTTPGALAEQANRVDLGYPKQIAHASYVPIRINSKWIHQSDEFRILPDTTDSFEFFFRYLSTPRTEYELNYSRYIAKAKSELLNTSSLGPLEITESSSSLDSLFVRFNYFWFDQQNFFHRVGLGFEAGLDSYPTFSFTGPNQLSISKARDFVVGLNLNYQRPISSNLLLIAIAGYNRGTGTGNTAELKTENNHSSYGTLLSSWAIDTRSSVEAGIDYRVRHAEIFGDRSESPENWESTSTNTTFKIGYTRSL